MVKDRFSEKLEIGHTVYYSLLHDELRVGHDALGIFNCHGKNNTWNDDYPIYRQYLVSHMM
ncbi:MAG: hypothetical protein ACTSRK_06365 [Promethearchaeota archaeon]